MHLRTFGVGNVTGIAPAAPLLGYGLMLAVLLMAAVIVLWRRTKIGDTET